MWGMEESERDRERWEERIRENSFASTTPGGLIEAPQNYTDYRALHNYSHLQNDRPQNS